MSDEKKPDQVFVVQQEKDFTPDGSLGVPADEVRAWVDIAIVSIPANTPRRIALKQALGGVGLAPGDEPPKLRALDAKSAEVHEPEAHQPPLEWRL